jgi:hypothetical protein
MITIRHVGSEKKYNFRTFDEARETILAYPSETFKISQYKSYAYDNPRMQPIIKHDSKVIELDFQPFYGGSDDNQIMN